MSVNGKVAAMVPTTEVTAVTAALDEHSRVTSGLREKIRAKREEMGGGLIAAVRELLVRHNDNCDACQRVRKLLPTGVANG